MTAPSWGGRLPGPPDPRDPRDPRNWDELLLDDPDGEPQAEAEPPEQKVKTLTGQLAIVALTLLVAVATGLSGYVQSCNAKAEAARAKEKAAAAQAQSKATDQQVDQVEKKQEKVEEAAAEAEVKAADSAAQVAETDYELDATYEATREKLDAVAGAVDALADSDARTRRRLSLLESAVKTALPNSPAMRRYQPEGPSKKRFSLRRVKKRLPKTAAQAAATVDPARLPEPPPTAPVDDEPTLKARPPSPSP